jgi:anti-sigma B factor antagonist
MFPAFELPARLSVDVRLCERGVTVTVRGEVDVRTAPELRARLQEVISQGEQGLVVHLDGVTFLDSTGLGVLVAAHKAQRAAGGTMEIVCGEPRVLKIIGLTGLDRVLDVRR